MSKEEKIPETKAEERAEEDVETEFVKEMAVEPVEVPDVTYEGEIVGEFDPKNVTVEELGLYMAGAKRM